MDAMQALLTRRSIRKFTNEPVSQEDVLALLRAGMQAPSANNSQPWHFIVVQERERLDKITEYHPWSKMCLEATLAIIVCAHVPPGKLYDMWIQDCAAASQNILLAAHILGLGGVWLDVHPREERVAGTKALFELPEYIRPFSILALGHPSESVAAVDRFDTYKVHYERW